MGPNAKHKEEQNEGQNVEQNEGQNKEHNEGQNEEQSEDQPFSYVVALCYALGVYNSLAPAASVAYSCMESDELCRAAHSTMVLPFLRREQNMGLSSAHELALADVLKRPPFAVCEEGFEGNSPSVSDTMRARKLGLVEMTNLCHAQFVEHL